MFSKTSQALQDCAPTVRKGIEMISQDADASRRAGGQAGGPASLAAGSTNMPPHAYYMQSPYMPCMPHPHLTMMHPPIIAGTQHGTAGGSGNPMSALYAQYAISPSVPAPNTDVDAERRSTTTRAKQDEKCLSSMTNDRIKLLEGSGFVGNAEEDAWSERFEELHEYNMTYGNCNVPKGWKENPELGAWVSTQRQEYRKLKEGKPSQMTAERIFLLEDTGFAWNTIQAAWSERYDELQAYKNRYGDCNVPKGWIENPKLGLWVYTQRQEYRKLKEDKPSAMTDERIFLLEDTGFAWSATEAAWSERFEKLQEYKKRYRDCNVPRWWEKNPQLGAWVNTQRHEYRKLKIGQPSSMTEERINLLESIGFDWNPNEAAWTERFEELQEYKKRYGDCNVPRHWKENPQLGSWFHRQRQECRKLKEGKPSQMTDERIKLLEGIGFDLHRQMGMKERLRQADWEERFEELQAYKRRYGDCNVPQRWNKNPQLGTWVKTQRQMYRKIKEGKPSPMTNERIDRLESIGFHKSGLLPNFDSCA